MHDLDRAILQAYHTVIERIAAAPHAAERARRLARAARIRSRPARPWCLALRAADTRLDDRGLSWTLAEDARRGRPHPVHLTQADLAALTSPITLGPFPGLPISEAARLLGRPTATITRWARIGALHAETYDRRVFNFGGTFGGPITVVWSPSPIDPNAENGRPPHQVWGTLWQHLAARVPRDWKCTLQRVPRPGVFGRDASMWQWVCPGLAQTANDQIANGKPEQDAPSLTLVQPPDEANPEEAPPAEAPTEAEPHQSPCGRLVDKLYLPLPCWSIADVHGHIESLGIPTPPWALPRGLIGQPMACHHCWNIQPARLTGHPGWNTFVSHITAGLLTGREVPRPEHDAPLEAKRMTRACVWRPHTTPRRQRVRQMLLAGHTYTEIASALDVTWRVVMTDAQAIYRAAGIPPGGGAKWALARKTDWGWGGDGEGASGGGAGRGRARSEGTSGDAGGRASKPAIPIAYRAFPSDIASGIYRVAVKPEAGQPVEAMIRMIAVGDDASSAVSVLRAIDSSGAAVPVQPTGELGPVRLQPNQTSRFEVVLTDPRRLALEVQAHETE